jgi:hypothetical protein
VQGGLTIIGLVALLLTGGSALAERRRKQRHNLDAVGWVPWPLVSILGTIGALFAFALAIKSGAGQ